MPGFDKALDKELFSAAAELGRSRLTVAVFSYNEGTAKLQISRENKYPRPKGRGIFRKWREEAINPWP